MSDPVRAKLREAMMNVSPLKEDPMTSEEQLGTPDWTIAPDKATHWDSGLRRFCNQYGFFDITGDFGRRAPVSWGTDRYVERPTGWDGTGLPPVGMECEVVIAAQKPRTVCFVGIKSSGSVVIETVDGELKSYHRSQVNFRPVRTQAQRERDEFVDFAARAYLSDRLESAPNLSGEQARKIAAFFYDAGMLRRAGE